MRDEGTEKSERRRSIEEAMAQVRDTLLEVIEASSAVLTPAAADSIFESVFSEEASLSSSPKDRTLLVRLRRGSSLRVLTVQ